MIQKTTAYSREQLEAMRNDPQIKLLGQEELYPIERDGHKFEIGEEVELCGLVEYPEYNGQTVVITNFRDNTGLRDRAYYIKGVINEHLNWVYEDRLKEKC